MWLPSQIDNVQTDNKETKKQYYGGARNKF